MSNCTATSNTGDIRPCQSGSATFMGNTGQKECQSRTSVLLVFLRVSCACSCYTRANTPHWRALSRAICMIGPSQSEGRAMDAKRQASQRETVILDSVNEG